VNDPEPLLGGKRSRIVCHKNAGSPHGFNLGYVRSKRKNRRGVTESRSEIILAEYERYQVAPLLPAKTPDGL